MHALLAVFALAAAQSPDTPTPPPDATTIMSRMAANMDASLDLRRQYVYTQKVRARLLRTNGQVARDEWREYTVTPGPERTTKTLSSFKGEYHKSKKEVIPYDKPGFNKGGMDIDGEIIDDLVNDLVDDSKSRDGIPHSLFPLSTKDLRSYKFTFKGELEFKGRKVYKVAFEPIAKSKCVNVGGDDDCPGKSWKGEVLVDAEEFQPVQIFTDLNFKMPWGVKVFLGTNLRQLGFSVSYARVAPNVWFPLTYGTEFRLDVLFGYKRVITLALDSSDFRRTGAESNISFAPVDK